MRTHRYIMYEAEEKGLELPYACRMGCCTACAVRLKEGEIYQPEALGISEELKQQGYALMCVGYPLTGEWWGELCVWVCARARKRGGLGRGHGLWGLLA